MRRINALVAATIAATGLAACSGSGDATNASSSQGVSASDVRDAPSQPRVSDAKRWDQSVCSKLDAHKVAKATGSDVEASVARKKVASDIGVPAFDFCTVALQRPGKGTPAAEEVRFGVSAGTWTAAEWAAYVKERERDGHDETHPVGDHEMVEDSSRMAQGRHQLLVGDRVLTVTSSLALPVPRIAAEMQLAMPYVAKVPLWPAKIVEPDCSKGDAAANGALGAQATIRRDSGTGAGLACSWSLNKAFVQVYAERQSMDWVPVVKAIQKRWPNVETVKNVGEAAVFAGARGGSPPTLRVATKKHLVFVQGQGGHVSKATLIALAKQVIVNY